MFKYIMILVMLSGIVNAHDMTPTYPKWKSSHVSGVIKTKIDLLNKRKDVEYYEIGVFDKDFKNVPFVTSYKILKLPYTKKVSFEIFINEEDRARAVYVCSRSKLRKEEKVRTAVSSRICSKFKD